MWLGDRFYGIRNDDEIDADDNDDDKIQKYFYRCQFSPIHGDDVVRTMFEIMYLEFG